MTTSERPAAARFLPPDAFAGRTALLTGGGPGRGLVIRRGLADLGARAGRAGLGTTHTLALEWARCGVRVNGECLVVDGGLSLGRSLWPPGARARRKRDQP